MQPDAKLPYRQPLVFKAGSLASLTEGLPKVAKDLKDNKDAGKDVIKDKLEKDFSDFY